MSEYDVGDFVWIDPVPPATELRRGICRFKGDTGFAEGKWVGIELVGSVGKNSGSVFDRQYFQCLPSQGVFVRPELVRTFAPASSPPPTAVVAAPAQSSTFDLQLRVAFEEASERVKELEALQKETSEKLEVAQLDLEITKEQLLMAESEVEELRLSAGSAGSGVDLSATVVALRKHVSSLEHKLKESEEHCRELDEQLKAVAQSDRVIESLTVRNLELDEELHAAREVLASVVKEKDESKEIIAIQDEEIRLLKDEIAESMAAFRTAQDRLEKECNSKDAAVNALRRDLNQLEGELLALKDSSSVAEDHLSSAAQTSQVESTQHRVLLRVSDRWLSQLALLNAQVGEAEFDVVRRFVGDTNSKALLLFGSVTRAVVDTQSRLLAMSDALAGAARDSARSLMNSVAAPLDLPQGQWILTLVDASCTSLVLAAEASLLASLIGGSAVDVKDDELRPSSAFTDHLLHLVRSFGAEEATNVLDALKASLLEPIRMALYSINKIHALLTSQSQWSLPHLRKLFASVADSFFSLRSWLEHHKFIPQAAPALLSFCTSGIVLDTVTRFCSFAKEGIECLVAPPASNHLVQDFCAHTLGKLQAHQSSSALDRCCGCLHGVAVTHVMLRVLIAYSTAVAQRLGPHETSTWESGVATLLLIFPESQPAVASDELIVTSPADVRSLFGGILVPSTLSRSVSIFADPLWNATQTLTVTHGVIRPLLPAHLQPRSDVVDLSTFMSETLPPMLDVSVAGVSHDRSAAVLAWLGGHGSSVVDAAEHGAASTQSISSTTTSGPQLEELQLCVIDLQNKLSSQTAQLDQAKWELFERQTENSALSLIKADFQKIQQQLEAQERHHQAQLKSTSLDYEVAFTKLQQQNIQLAKELHASKRHELLKEYTPLSQRERMELEDTVARLQCRLSSALHAKLLAPVAVEGRWVAPEDVPKRELVPTLRRGGLPKVQRCVSKDECRAAREYVFLPRHIPVN